jgi:hypothetical protein
MQHYKDVCELEVELGVPKPGGGEQQTYQAPSGGGLGEEVPPLAAPQPPHVPQQPARAAPQPRARVAPASVVTLNRALDMVGATPGAQVMAVRAVMGMEGDSLDWLLGAWLPSIEEKLRRAEAAQRAAGAQGPSTGTQGASGSGSGGGGGTLQVLAALLEAALPGCTRGGAVCGAAGQLCAGGPCTAVGVEAQRLQ